MANKGYQNQLTKPRIEAQKQADREREKMERCKLQIDTIGDREREISTYRGGYNVND